MPATSEREDLGQLRSQDVLELGDPLEVEFHAFAHLRRQLTRAVSAQGLTSWDRSLVMCLTCWRVPVSPVTPSPITKTPATTATTESTDRPSSLQEVSSGCEQAVGSLAAERQDRDDRQQRQHEADVEDQHQEQLPHRTQARSDDRCDHREVGECGRQFDDRDRRAEQPGAPAAAADVRRLSLAQPRAVKPQDTPQSGSRLPPPPLTRIASCGWMGHQRQQQLSRPECDRGPADEIDGEHAHGELDHPLAGMFAGGEVQGGRPRSIER